MKIHSFLFTLWLVLTGTHVAVAQSFDDYDRRVVISNGTSLITVYLKNDHFSFEYCPNFNRLGCEMLGNGARYSRQEILFILKPLFERKATRFKFSDFPGGFVDGMKAGGGLTAIGISGATSLSILMSMVEEMSVGDMASLVGKTGLVCLAATGAMGLYHTYDNKRCFRTLARAIETVLATNDRHTGIVLMGSSLVRLADRLHWILTPLEFE